MSHIIFSRNTGTIEQTPVPTNNLCINFLHRYCGLNTIIIDSRHHLTPTNTQDFIIFASTECNWLNHRIANTKADIMGASSQDLWDNTDLFYDSSFIQGDIVIPEDNTKLYAYGPPIGRTGCSSRIVTDIETLRYVRKELHPFCINAVYWYYSSSH